MTDPTSPSWHDQAAAYALGALTPDEARALEAELARSPELRREVAAYAEVVAALPHGTSAVPRDLRARMLARVRQERGASLTPRVPGWLWMALAASVVLAAGLGYQTRVLRRSLQANVRALAERDGRLADQERLLQNLLDPAVSLVPLTTNGETPPLVQVYWNRQRHTAILAAFRLPPAAAGRAYQLWVLAGEGAPIPSRLFNSTADGRAVIEDVVIPPGAVVRGFAVTEEPAGGSPSPTTPILVLGTVGTD